MDWAPVVDYAALRAAALEQKKPLVVFINTPPRTIPGTLGYWTADFFGQKEPQVLVGYPKGKDLYQLPLKADVTDTELLKRVTAAGRNQKVVEKRVFEYRQAKGHTHTCSHGHTWDHTMDKDSHNCPYCGEHVEIVDSTSKMVTVEVNPRAVVHQPVSIERSSRYRADCPNGNCPYVR